LDGTLTIAADGYVAKTLDITPLYSTQSLEIELISTADPASTAPSKNKPDPSAARAEANEGFLFLASQASDVGSIPIARSISLDDSVALTRLSY
jgi:hypothetical protein